MSRGNLSRPFILRPVATTLMMLAILLSGWVALRFLPLSALPQVDYPTLQISTLYPGASPDVVSTTVTAPLERQFGQLPGLLRMNSTSSGGASIITLQFTLDRPMDTIEQEVQSAIQASTSLLPSDLSQPPVYRKVNPADAPVLTLALSSATLPLPQIEEMASTRVASRISRVSGVGLVSLGGAQRPAVRIRIDPDRAAARGMTLAQVRQAIGNANVNAPKGSLEGEVRAASLDADDQLRTAADYQNLVLAWREGAPVRVRDIGSVVDGAENRFLAAWAGVNGVQEPAVILSIQRQPGANVIETVDAVKALLPRLESTLPAAVHLQLLGDRTESIRASIAHVQFELSLAVVLVVLVIYVFLRSARATLIPAVVVPLSLAGTLGVMYLAGFSINNLSLMALTIATGFVVDDAIVMIENIDRHIARGGRVLDAAIEGAGQIGFTIISLTISLVAVLIPLLFMGDVVGRLFREFAVTLAVAVLVSGFVSLTLTPMMAARLLPPHGTVQRENFFLRACRVGLDAVQAAYGRALWRVLRWRVLTLSVAVLTLVMTVVLYIIIPKGLFPIQDTGALQVITQADPSVSFQAMSRHQQRLADTLLEDPAVATIASVIGIDGSNTTLNTGRMQISLVPRSQREGDAQTVIRRLQERIADVPGITAWMQPVQDLTIDSRQGRGQFQFTLSDTDPATLATWAPRLLDALREMPQLTTVASDGQEGGRQVQVRIDRDRAARLGVSVADIVNALYDAYGQRPISSIFTQSSLYRVILEVGGAADGGPQSIGRLLVMGSGATPVPLASLVDLQEGSGPLVMSRVDQFPSVTLSFNLAPGVALSEAVQAIRDTEARLQMPASIQTTFEGAALAFEASLANMVVLILASLVTLYIVLGVLYESYIHPITILSTLPSAGVGALLALDLGGYDLGVVAIIGLILLIGIVKKNAIMMIDFALEAVRERGLAPRDAIHEASLMRFRPILMTTMAAVLGALPLLLGGGEGSELRQPLGVALVAGLLVSQVLTLFTTPVIYLALDRWSSPLPAASGGSAAVGGATGGTIPAGGAAAVAPGVTGAAVPVAPGAADIRPSGPGGRHV